MPQHDHARKRRRLLLLAYPLLYLLTFLGIYSAEPQLWGIPLWYLGGGLAILLLVPLNLLFTRTAWPEREEDG